MRNLLVIKVCLVCLLLTNSMWANQLKKKEKFTVCKSGQIKINNQQFDDFTAYFTSDYFKTHNKRCNTKILNKKNIRIYTADQSDCTCDVTVIKDEYWPSQVYTIPVVFHNIFRDDGTGFLPNERFFAQIDVLNETFRALLSTDDSTGFDTAIQFELAGITRTKNDIWYNDMGEMEYKSILGWDQERFLNVYTNSCSGYLGYSYFPQDVAGNLKDGVAILSEALGGRDNGYAPYDQGHTLVHEIGHYLGLLHTFEGYDCFQGYDTGDLINDTYPENQEHYCCIETFSCDTLDNIHNYMNYTDDICMYEFTPDQANRMRCCLLNYRPLLILNQYSNLHFLSLPPNKCFVNQSYNYQAVAESADRKFCFFSLSQGPESMVIDPDTGVLTWFPGDSSLGKHFVEIMVRDGYNESFQRFMITVTKEYDPPVAAFFADTLSGIAPFTVDFVDQSKGEIYTRIWDFGDFDVDYCPDPSHVYYEAGEYSVSLKVTGPGGSNTMVQSNYIKIDSPTAVENKESLPMELFLNQNYPNPFNASTTISYQLTHALDARISIFDMNGRLISTVEDNHKQAGFHKIVWNGLDDKKHPVASGIYLIQLKAGDFVTNKKALLLK